MDELRGVIATYWAQGMEEGEWLIFQEEATIRRGDDGREQWLMEGMWPLEAGGRLTIVGPDGSTWWSGTLAWRRPGLLGLVGEPTLTPPEIAEARWLAWFHHEPPLVARYTPPRPRAPAT